MGVKEVMLIAQELTYYGLDIYKKRDVARSAKSTGRCEGIGMDPVHYAYPSKFPLEILDVMRERENICNYLDMPLQHASDAMLKAMKRQITRSEMTELIYAIREKVPGICLQNYTYCRISWRTGIDVEEMKDFLTEHRFDRVGIFTYSHEEGTSAFSLEDDVPAEGKRNTCAGSHGSAAGNFL